MMSPDLFFTQSSAWILAAALWFMRVSAATFTLSRLRGFLGPWVAQGLCMLLAIFFLSREEPPEIVVPMENMEKNGVAILVLLVQSGAYNLGVGLLAALPMALLLESLPMAARLLDAMRGSQYAEQLLPGMENRASVLETLAGLLAVTVFFHAELYERILIVLGGPSLLPFSESHRQLPISSEVLHSQLLTLTQRCLELSVQLVAPAVLTLLLFELAIAVLSRFGVRMPFANELASVRLLFGLGLAGLLVSAGRGEYFLSLVRTLP